MAICKSCNKEMSSGESCSHKFLVKEDGSRYARVPFLSEEEDFFDDDNLPENCPDCGVKKGGIHHDSCDVERCPICNDQLISCDCGFVSTVEGTEE